jgi:2-oxoglutarate dehydrogenase E2 component (dihydrolipoamide succinyltransferase)
MATGTAVDVVMPQMGVSVSEGTITKWLKSEGEAVEADESLLEISTDKVDTEIPSPASGVLRQILTQEGETVAVGTKIAVIAPEGAPQEAPAEGPPEPATAAAAQEASVAAGAEGETPTAETVEEAVPPAPAAPEPPAPAAPEPPAPAAPAPPAPVPERAEPEPTPAAAAPITEGDGRKEPAFVSPVVARIASEHGVDISRVEGTGRGGRVTKKDILDFIESGAPVREEAPPAPEPAPAAEAAEAPPAPAPEAPPAAPPEAPAPRAPEPAAAPVAEKPELEPGETLEPVTAMRKGIAEHMRRSLDTSAHVTTTFEIDLSKVVTVREKLKQEYEERYGVRLTYLAFIARATVDAIVKWPWMNAELRGESIVVKGYVNLGIAVALEGGKGLIVPVVRNAEGMNLLGLARGIQDVAERARSKRLVPDDVQGGTFTITNPGGFGAIHGTPIISQPQVAILDVEALVKRPIVVSDEAGKDVIAIRPMMNLCLSYDHRLVDGAYAAQFMRDLKQNLQTWDETAY